jgi:hypothetical protein
MREVKYGATITLCHVPTGHFLGSPGYPYVHPGTSGQDQVTCASRPSNTSSWIVKPPHAYPDAFLYGQSVKDGDVIRLENRASQKNLHSHADRRAPINDQQEITCFGSRGVGDINDNWKVEIQGHGVWRIDSQIRLVHTLTNAALHSHGGQSDPKMTSGELEVTGYAARDNNDLWQVETVASPLVPPFIGASTSGSRFFSIISFVGSLASISGITFLFVGASLKTATYADIISIVFASLLFLGALSACSLVIWDLYVRVRLRTRNVGWYVTFWLLSIPGALFGSLLLWRFAAETSNAYFKSLLLQTFSGP